MEAVAIVTILALIQYTYFGIQVGGAHQKYGVKVPAMSGDQQFERVNRVHQNTLEQLLVLIPALWMYAYFVNPLWGAGLGVVYLIGRFIYSSAYKKDPSSRSLGFMLSFLPSTVMLAWVLVVASMSYL
jgi:glutathione S-transferase